MFTGIIEETGVLLDLRLGEEEGRICIGAKRVLEGTRLGDSISVNGACLTVTRLLPEGFWADVMPETVRRTALRRCKSGDRVNLERAMACGGRFGGHLVTGHVDGVGEIEDIRREGNARLLTIRSPEEILSLVVEKGSIAIDGVSLTVARLLPGAFQVGIIPHTGEETTLLGKRPGDLVNLETDLIGKYVRRLLSGGLAGTTPSPAAREDALPGGLTLEALAEMGF